MVIFEKNGQGKWDFNFEILENLTSLEFVTRLKLELNCGKYDTILDVKTQNLITYFCIYIKTELQLVELQYDKQTKETKRRAIGIMVIEEFYNEKNS